MLKRGIISFIEIDSTLIQKLVSKYQIKCYYTCDRTDLFRPIKSERNQAEEDFQAPETISGSVLNSGFQPILTLY